MEVLRAEIRAAFEREQAPYPFAGAVDLRRPRPNRVQWLAVAAALVIGTLVVVSLISTRLSSVPAPAHRPAGDYGPPPAGEPLFYVGDPGHPGWYIGFDWQGVPRGTIKLAQPLDQYTTLEQSPDGSAFFSDDRGLSYGPPLDRLGQPQTAFPVPAGLRQLVWADDNRHLCSIAWQDGNILLSWHVPGFTDNVAVVGKVSVVQPGVSVGIAGCSFKSDPRAVLEQDSGAGVPTDLWIVHLTDGKVLMHEKIASGYANSFVVSRDTTMVAINSLGAPHTVVRDLAGGASTNLDPALSVIAISADDKVVLATRGWSEGFPTQLEAIELATGKVLWSTDGAGEELTGFFVEPAGAGFALLLKDPKDQELHPKVYVSMVFAYGLSYGIPGQFVRP